MPRLTDTTYLIHRGFLVEDWGRRGCAMSLLPGGDQLTLHHYYRPAEQLSDHEALAHRRKIGKGAPSLPQRAGKIIAHLRVLTAEQNALSEARLWTNQHVAVRTKHQRQPRGEVRARVLVHPTPNYKLLAQALLDHVHEQEAKKALTDQDADAA